MFEKLIDLAKALFLGEKPMTAVVVLTLVAEAGILYYPPELVMTDCKSFLTAQVVLASLATMFCIIKLIQILKEKK